MHAYFRLYFQSSEISNVYVQCGRATVHHHLVTCHLARYREVTVTDREVVKV